MTTHITGQLQIDHERGVIYFHADADAMVAGHCPTPLRIQGLGQLQYPQEDRQIDIAIHPMREQKINTRTGQEVSKGDSLLIAEVSISK